MGLTRLRPQQSLSPHRREKFQASFQDAVLFPALPGAGSAGLLSHAPLGRFVGHLFPCLGEHAVHTLCRTAHGDFRMSASGLFVIVEGLPEANPNIEHAKAAANSTNESAGNHHAQSRVREK